MLGDSVRDGREPQSHGTRPSARPEQPRASQVWGMHPAPRTAAGGRELRVPDRFTLCVCSVLSPSSWRPGTGTMTPLQMVSVPYTWGSGWLEGSCQQDLPQDARS